MIDQDGVDPQAGLLSRRRVPVILGAAPAQIVTLADVDPRARGGDPTGQGQAINTRPRRRRPWGRTRLSAVGEPSAPLAASESHATASEIHPLNVIAGGTPKQEPDRDCCSPTTVVGPTTPGAVGR